jgi:hypothetical protein
MKETKKTKNRKEKNREKQSNMTSVDEPWLLAGPKPDPSRQALVGRRRLV